MNPLLMAAALAGAPVPESGGELLAQLRVLLDGPEMVVAVRDRTPEARVFSVDCVANCAARVRFEEAGEGYPLGLYQPSDSQPIVLSVWATGSAYRVRAHRLAAGGVTRVLDAATLGLPDIRVAANGIEVRTTERRTERSARDAARTILWTWRGGRFVRRGL